MLKKLFAENDYLLIAVANDFTLGNKRIARTRELQNPDPKPGLTFEIGVLMRKRLFQILNTFHAKLGGAALGG